MITKIVIKKGNNTVNKVVFKNYGICSWVNTVPVKNIINTLFRNIFFYIFRFFLTWVIEGSVSDKKLKKSLKKEKGISKEFKYF